MANGLSLAQLPTLVLSTIASFVEPTDLSCFAVACRTLHDAAAIRLKHHQHLIAKYSDVTIGFSDHDDLDGSFSDFVHDLFEEPDIAQYVRTLSFAPYTEYHSPDRLSLSDLDRLVENTGDWIDGKRLQRLRSEFGDEAQTSAEQMSMIAFPFLLQKLTRIAHLRLRGCLDIDADITLLLQLVTRCTLRAYERMGCLEYLRSVYIEHWDTENGVCLEYLVPFRYLPSLERIEGYMVERWNNPNQCTSPGPPLTFTSNVTEISFERSAVQPEELIEFMKPLKRLKHVTYDHGGVVTGGDVNIETNEDYNNVFKKVPGDWLEHRNMEVSTDEDGAMTISLRSEDTSHG